MIDLNRLRGDLVGLTVEATNYGLSKALRDRIDGVLSLVSVIEAEREKRS